MNINFIPVKTRVVHPPKDKIWDIIDSLDVKDEDIIFITSKILSIHQGRTVKADSIAKEELIKQETKKYLPYYNQAGNYHFNLTINQGILIPAAGIDASNADGHFILWPTNVDGLCQEIRQHLMRKFNLKNLGVVATDSHSTPLRYGVTGFTIGFAGIEPLEDIRGKKDLFGRNLHITRVNLIDPLASMAVLLMGESSESTPIVILRDWTKIPFSEAASMSNLKVPEDEDLYSPLLKVLANTQQ